ncbi:RING-H2 finger protein ATL52-like protein [Tanacetum coccineum]
MAMDNLGSSSSSSSSSSLSSTTSSETFSTNSFFTPLLISIMGIGTVALAILIYHLLLVKYCMRRHAARMAALRNYANEEVPVGVDEKTLKIIPIIAYKGNEDNQCENECAVCLGDLEDGDMVRLLPICKHLFHVKCIDEWFVGHTSCPVCRVPVVGPDDEIRGCPVCRPAGHTSDDCISSNSNERIEVDNADEFTSRRRIMLRHCHSLVLPGEKKGRFTGMELKRSLSMGQSTCVTIDINIENMDNDCTYYSSFRDQSIRQIQRVSSKVRESISRMCVGQGQESAILPY